MSIASSAFFQPDARSRNDRLAKLFLQIRADEPQAPRDRRNHSDLFGFTLDPWLDFTAHPGEEEAEA